jgi:hypothetical protein
VIGDIVVIGLAELKEVVGGWSCRSRPQVESSRALIDERPVEEEVCVVCEEGCLG